MKKQPNSPGSLLACHPLDNSPFMLYFCLMRLSDFSSSGSSPSAQMLTIIPSAFYSFSDVLFFNHMFNWITFLLSWVTGHRIPFNVIYWLYEHTFQAFIEVNDKDKIIIWVLGVYCLLRKVREQSFIHNFPFMQYPHFTIKTQLTNFHQVPHELIILLMCQSLKP